MARKKHSPTQEAYRKGWRAAIEEAAALFDGEASKRRDELARFIAGPTSEMNVLPKMLNINAWKAKVKEAEHNAAMIRAIGDPTDPPRRT